MNIPAKHSISLGVILCMLSVILGAFGAHALKSLLSSRMLEVYQTGIQYQMFHASALVLVGLFALLASHLQLSQRVFTHLSRASALFLLGILLFCGSLYGLAFSEAALGERISWLGLITPLGGLAFILGWLYLFFAVKHSDL